MEKKYRATGFCPKASKDIEVSVTYIFNTNCWEKGISEPPCSRSGTGTQDWNSLPEQ